MFFLFILLFLGGSYIYWKYSSVHDKKAFFYSPFFISITGSLSLLIAGLFIVNKFAPEGSDVHIKTNSFDGAYSLVDTTLSTPIDTSYYSLRSQINLTGHYKLIKSLALGNIDELVTLEKHYQSF